MKWHTVLPLVRKDLTLFVRNRFFAFVTVLALVAYAGLYLAMPATVDEVLEVGLYAPPAARPLVAAWQEQGVVLELAESEPALQNAVLDGRVAAGVALPSDMAAQMTAGQKPVVTLYLAADAPPDIRELMVVMVEGLSLVLTGEPLAIQVNEETLGADMAGMQIPPRDRMLPLLVILVLMMETLGLASLIAEEVGTGTLRALMVTPMGVRELFLGKGLTSLALIMSQVLILAAIVGALRTQPMLMILALLLGALMVTGLGFLIASTGRDLLSVMGLGVLVIVVLSVPAFGVLVPGSVTEWVKVIPSFYLADTFHRVANLGQGVTDVWSNLAILLAWDVALFWAGAAVLKRKFT